MSGSSYGKLFTITTWGESHGKGLGVVIDGCPAGVELCEEDIQRDLDRRKPGNSPFATKRKESDTVQILSGIYEGKTTGTPISLMVLNTDQRSRDYGDIATYYRPGHADYSYDMKYGFRDFRGGGRSSGRETVGRVAAGAIAKKILQSLGVKIITYTQSIGNIEIDKEKFNADEILNNCLCMPDKDAYEKAAEYLESIKKQTNSAGGVVECIVEGMPAGVGEPVFDKLDAALAKGIFSIGAVKGLEIGTGFGASKVTGFENNDFLRYDENGNVVKLSNNAGGILGGISDGSPIFLRAAFKPTPSISTAQQTINKSGENIDVVIKGRHDPIIVPRAVIVIESMVALTLLDNLLQSMTSKIDTIKKIFLNN